eukprot:1177516-Prorocentrum_minimum.AAC.3
MKATAELALGCEVKKAVVTVPAYFNDAQRRLTKVIATSSARDIRHIPRIQLFYAPVPPYCTLMHDPPRLRALTRSGCSKKRAATLTSAR